MRLMPYAPRFSQTLTIQEGGPLGGRSHQDCLNAGGPNFGAVGRVGAKGNSTLGCSLSESRSTSSAIAALSGGAIWISSLYHYAMES